MEEKHPAELELEEYRRKRGEAKQHMQDLENQRQQAISKGDPVLAVKLNQSIREAKDEFEDAETRDAAAEAHIELLKANRPKAEEAKRQADATWIQIISEVEKLQVAQATVKEATAKILDLKGSLERFVSEYCRLTEEGLVPHPDLTPILSNTAIALFADTSISTPPPWQCLTEREWRRLHEAEIEAREKAEEAKRRENLEYLRTHPPLCPKCRQPMTLTDSPPQKYGGTELQYVYICNRDRVRFQTSVEDLKRGVKPIMEARPFMIR
jgi:hypothetical protein